MPAFFRGLHETADLLVVVPNLIDDMQRRTVSQGDTAQEQCRGLQAMAQTHNSLLIMTFDEDSSGNKPGRTIFDGKW